MNRPQAQRVLSLYRPGVGEAVDSETRAALALLERDAELREWFENEQALHSVLRDRLRRLPVPEGLPDRILAEANIIRAPAWWRRPAWLAAAAAVVLLLSLVLFNLGPRVPDRFADLRSRLVATVLRQYQMDIRTNSMPAIRAFLANRGAPSNYEVPAGLQRLKLTGAGRLEWRRQPVSMLCFDEGDGEMVFLFVTPRSAAQHPPGATPVVARVKKLLTASWTVGEVTYLLAGSPARDFPSKYF